MDCNSRSSHSAKTNSLKKENGNESTNVNDGSFKAFVTYTRNETGDDGSSYELQLEQIGFIPIQNDKFNKSNTDSELDMSSYESHMTYETPCGSFDGEIHTDLIENDSAIKTILSSYISNPTPTNLNGNCSNLDVGFKSGESHYSSTKISSNSSSTSATRPSKNTVKSGDSYRQGNVEKVKNIFTIESSEKLKLKIQSDKIIEQNLNPLLEQNLNPATNQVVNNEQTKNEGTDSQSEKNFLKKKILLLTKGTETSRIYSKNPSSVEKKIVPTPWIQNLKTVNLLNDLKNLATTPMHDPKKCTECSHVYNAEEQQKLLSQLIGRVRTPLTENKVQDHLTTYTSINQIGEISRTLPRVRIQNL